MTKRPRVAIVEDDVLIATFFESMCRQLGADLVGTAYDSAEACEMLLKQRPDYVLMDVRLGGGMDGVGVSLTVIPELPECRVIFVTGSSEPRTISRINTDHPHRILIKPVSSLDIAEALGMITPP